MPRGERKLLIERQCGNRLLQVYKVGPFWEVQIDGICIGSCRRKEAMIVPPGSEHTECLRLPRHIVVLTDEDLITMTEIPEDEIELKKAGDLLNAKSSKRDLEQRRKRAGV